MPAKPSLVGDVIGQSSCRHLCSPDYLFIQDTLEAATYYTVSNLPGGAAFGSQPQSVPPETIASVKLALAGYRTYSPYNFLQKGKWVGGRSEHDFSQMEN
jgi:hypothetical protein